MNRIKLSLTMALMLTVLASASLSAKPNYLPAPGEVRTYYQNGVQVGRAVHNQCTGQISIQGTVTPDYIGSFTVSC
ncbi:hypothetical protein [Pseudomonas sp. CGJS7]|uniref:hypothetical protein n=1 Tax=Pseudomonas sp. CGJS7 TaxID=3109348 RepID=UPI00300B25E9